MDPRELCRGLHRDHDPVLSLKKQTETVPFSGFVDIRGTELYDVETEEGYDDGGGAEIMKRMVQKYEKTYFMHWKSFFFITFAPKVR